MTRRAHETAARLALRRLLNAASVQGDATAMLERWLAPRTLVAIYVNHPEPPQQSAGGASGTAVPEGAHMLNGRMLRAAAAALRPGGTLTIVTDNGWYAGVLLDSFAALGGAFRPASKRVPDGGRLVRSTGGFDLIAAPPGEWCGHATAAASSYFDRLWKTGLSAHSATHERYVLYVRTAAATTPKGGKAAANSMSKAAEPPAAAAPTSLAAAKGAPAAGAERVRKKKRRRGSDTASPSDEPALEASGEPPSGSSAPRQALDLEAGAQSGKRKKKKARS
mmetsp:Transcript_27086/g.72709  ORF Transcript_27086/g.72709 Transcript_27086/m.72709 type:complete len:279 (-) Transcript_27086:374-1210(-)